MKYDKIILPNWTQRKDTAGGCETVYSYLNKILPNSELVSGKDIYNNNSHGEMIEIIDNLLIEEYKKNKNILVIRDNEFGGAIDTSMIDQITIFANPFKQINRLFKEYLDEKDDLYSQVLLSRKYKIDSKKKVTVSNYMANELKKEGIEMDYIIPNGIDINVFKPLGDKVNLRKKYEIPKSKRVGIWVGERNCVKNVEIISDLIYNYDDVFWILVSKTNFKYELPNSKVFVDMNEKEMVELYNCADFFLLTSPIESCGIAMLEAMSCNLPCILSKAGYFWDFWDQRIGVQISDWKNLEEHINALDKLKEIETSSREVIIERKLDINSWKEKWEEVINSIK